MIRVFDADGNEKSLEWALNKYNVKLVIAAKSRDRWEVVALHEVIGPSSMTVRVNIKDGIGAFAIPVAFWWPGAWEDENAVECHPTEPKQPRKIRQITDLNGQTGFGMGGGAYYHPSKGEQGPHAVWVSEYPQYTSDLVDGLGMIGSSNHAHLEPTFQFAGGEIVPPPNCQEYISALERIGEIIDDVL